MTRLAVVILLAISVGGSVWAGDIDPNLEMVLAEMRDEDVVSTLVFLWDQADAAALTADLNREKASMKTRHERVVRALQQVSSNTQRDLLANLDEMQATRAVANHHAFWIANCIRVDATAEAIRRIAAHPDVWLVYYNYEIEGIEPVASGASRQEPSDSRSPEVGLTAIRAPEVWALGLTGEGILVATLDTGVDGNHPALASRWRGVADSRYIGHPEWAWFDPVTFTTFPQSFGAHGTHTMGSVCGGAPGDQIGVAPGAQWIHAAVIDRVSIPQTAADAILAFEWMLDPDGDPSTNWDVPAVCSNSWGLTTGHGYPPCDETFWSYLDACEAAGILITFSAGNEGFSGLRRPSDRATDAYRTMAVAAVNANDPGWPIASFSSRGPTTCTPDGGSAIKPDIAAPGVAVRSAVPGGGYESFGWDGTSMASPHVNGTVALMRQACPDLTVEQLKQIIYETAQDLGNPGEDNDYGWGMVDAYEAVIMALDWCIPGPDGEIKFDREIYVCEDVVAIEVRDFDLNLDDGVAETVDVTISSDTESGGETVTLTETDGDSAKFAGSVALSAVDAAGVLWVSEGDTVTTTYIDADNGQGGFDVEVTDTALVDCTVPVIANVQTTGIEPRSAVVTFDTDEPTRGTVHYGLSCDALAESASGSGYSTSPSVGLTGLDDNTTYFYAVEAQDEAGNVASDDNDGVCFAFTTPEIPDFFTELFGSGNDNDLDYLTLTFEPNGSFDYYVGCTEPIDALPTDPAGGTALSITEDGNQQVTLSGGETVSLYGVSYSSFYVCDNGYITFGGSDGDYTESLEDHFDMPRISPLFDDFSVDDAAGNVSWKQLPDRAVVTYENVPEYNTSNSSTFQVEMFFNGTIVISYLDVAVTDGLTGLSAGDGLSPDYYATDLSDMGNCGPKPPTAQPVEVTGPVGTDAIAIILQATDDDLPEPPALTYKVTTLPIHGGLYETGFGQVIAVPHELAGGGNELSYQPEPSYSGGDSFQYTASDGGVPPDGGDSAPAVVSITVGGAAWDPQAFNVSASTPASTPVNITLYATDPNGDPLTYFVESLPASGTLSDPGAGEITAVPYELTAGGDVVTYTPPAGESMTASFDYSAMDETAGSNLAQATVTVGGPAWEPVAYPVTAATPISTPVDITLHAIDPNGDPLTYFIESLPPEGSLSDPGAGAIETVPYELADGGAVVRYVPPVYQNLEAEFDYSAADATAGSNVAQVSITVGGPMTFFADDFETDKGWFVEDIDLVDGTWQRAIPVTGAQGAPSTDFDGSGRCYLTNNALGADVDGGPTRLTSPAVSLAEVIEPKLRYARWITCDDAGVPAEDFLVVEVSSDDGGSWVTIESVPHTVGWVERTIEITDYVTPTAQMKLRFSATDNPNNSITEAAVDAIEIWGLPIVEVPGDYDHDGVIDLADYAYFPGCMSGPDAGPVVPECAVFYFDADDDVDLQDFRGLQALLPEFE